MWGPGDDGSVRGPGGGFGGYGGGFGRGRGRGPGREAAPPPADDLPAYLAGRLPDEWFVGAPEVTVDRDEVTVVGTLSEPATPAVGEQGTSGEADSGANSGGPDEGAARPAAETGRIRRFRELTREQRIVIAREIEQRFGRHVAWGAAVGGTREIFTSAAVPAMTRLRQPERIVLDTLVDAGVARSRSDALAWCVRLVGQHSESWLDELRQAMRSVQDVRDAGPDAAG